MSPRHRPAPPKGRNHVHGRGASPANSHPPEGVFWPTLVIGGAEGEGAFSVHNSVVRWTFPSAERRRNGETQDAETPRTDGADMTAPAATSRSRRWRIPFQHQGADHGVHQRREPLPTSRLLRRPPRPRPRQHQRPVPDAGETTSPTNGRTRPAPPQRRALALERDALGASSITPHPRNPRRRRGLKPPLPSPSPTGPSARIRLPRRRLGRSGADVATGWSATT